MGKFNNKKQLDENDNIRIDEIDWKQFVGDSPNQSVDDKTRNLMNKVYFDHKN